MQNSLSSAVAAGIIAEEAAFCGLSPADVNALVDAGFGSLEVVVRVRSARGDGRGRLSLDNLDRLGPNETIVVGGLPWAYGEIRDIMAATVSA
jgi:hypothetical protein